MKKIAILAAIFLLTGLFSISSFAKDEIKVIVSGTKVDFDVAPQIIDGRTMVPVRAIFEAMGAIVTWDDESKTAMGEKLGRTVELTVGEKKADYSGKKVAMDASPIIKDGRVLVPARYASEGFGYEVLWVQEENTVLIYHDTDNLRFYDGTKIPDYGALYNIEHIKSDSKTYIYSVRDILSNDPEILSAEDYIDILYDMGFSYDGKQKISGEGKKGEIYIFLNGKDKVGVGIVELEEEKVFYINTD